MTKTKYFTCKEVAIHNTVDDLWVSVFGKVLDLTSLCKSRNEDDPELFPLLAFGGKDVTHFFDEEKEVKTHLDPNTNKLRAFLPFGRFIDAPTPDQVEWMIEKKRLQDEERAHLLANRVCAQRNKSLSSNIESLMLKREFIAEEEKLPWWKDEKFVIGLLSQKTRVIRIRNTLIKKDVLIEVCSEENMEAIQERYLKFNKHTESYTWKYLGSKLDMEETLQENGIPDRDDLIERLRLDPDNFIPTISLYFNDDLTEL